MAAPVSSESHRLLVLLVDDDKRTTTRLAQMLREDGFNVEIATDGAAAIARLARRPIPDVLVTEVVLPHAGGIDVAHYARARSPKMRVFIVTGYPHLVATDPEPMEPPARVLTKPIDYEVLRGMMTEGVQSLPVAARIARSSLRHR